MGTLPRGGPPAWSDVVMVVGKVLSANAHSKAVEGVLFQVQCVRAEHVKA